MPILIYSTGPPFTGDNFTGNDGDLPDSIRWDIIEDQGDPPNYGAYVFSNKLRTDLVGGNQVTYGVRSKWSYVSGGDFDMQVSFYRITSNTGQSMLSVQWSSGWSFRFGLTTSQYRVVIEDPTYGYTAVGPAPPGVGVEGKVRITKAGTLMTAYYWDVGGTEDWIAIYGWNFAPTNETSTVSIYTNSGSYSTTIDWDNFTINSGTIIT